MLVNVSTARLSRKYPGISRSSVNQKSRPAIPSREWRFVYDCTAYISLVERHGVPYAKLSLTVRRQSPNRPHSTISPIMTMTMTKSMVLSNNTTSCLPIPKIPRRGFTSHMNNRSQLRWGSSCSLGRSYSAYSLGSFRCCERGWVVGIGWCFRRSVPTRSRGREWWWG